MLLSPWIEYFYHNFNVILGLFSLATLKWCKNILKQGLNRVRYFTKLDTYSGFINIRYNIFCNKLFYKIKKSNYVNNKPLMFNFKFRIDTVGTKYDYILGWEWTRFSQAVHWHVKRGRFQTRRLKVYQDLQVQILLYILDSDLVWCTNLRHTHFKITNPCGVEKFLP